MKNLIKNKKERKKNLKEKFNSFWYNQGTERAEVKCIKFGLFQYGKGYRIQLKSFITGFVHFILISGKKVFLNIKFVFLRRSFLFKKTDSGEKCLWKRFPLYFVLFLWPGLHSGFFPCPLYLLLFYRVLPFYRVSFKMESSGN